MNKSYSPLLTDEQMTNITSIVKEIEKLSDIEKLLLYLHLPGGTPVDTDVKTNKTKNSSDLFGKKADQEITQTYTWILSHLEEDCNVSLPKQEVYDEYKAYCEVHRFEPLCVADFGKAMKHAFPRVKPRRLGQRGNSRYCYSGLRKKYTLQPPSLPSLIDINEISSSFDPSTNDDHEVTNFHHSDDKPNINDSTMVSNLSNVNEEPKHVMKSENIMKNEMEQQHRTHYINTDISSSQQPHESSSMNMVNLNQTTSQLPCTPDDDDYHHNNQLERSQQQQQFDLIESVNPIFCSNVNQASFDSSNNTNKTELVGNSFHSSFNTIVTCNMNNIDNDQNHPGCLDRKTLRQSKKKVNMKRSVLNDEASNVCDLLGPTKKMYIKTSVIERQCTKNDINCNGNYKELCQYPNNNCDQTRTTQKQHNCRDEHCESKNEGLAELREILEKNLPPSQLQPQSNLGCCKNVESVLTSELSGQVAITGGCFENGIAENGINSFNQMGAMQQFSNSQMSPTSINESHSNSLNNCPYDPSLDSLMTENSTAYLHNDVVGKSIDDMRYIQRTYNEDDDVSLHPDQCIQSSIDHCNTYAMAHNHIIQDSPLNSTYSTPAEHVSIDTIHSHQHAHIPGCQQTDANAHNSGNHNDRQSPIYGHQQEQDYNQAMQDNDNYSVISDRHMIANDSYVPQVENTNYTRFYYSQQSHHQALYSPFVSPSSTPNPFIEKYDQHDSYHLPLFND